MFLFINFASFTLEIARSLLLRNLSFSGQGPKNWALEYHTLMLFLIRNPDETKVYTFFSLVT